MLPLHNHHTVPTSYNQPFCTSWFFELQVVSFNPTLYIFPSRIFNVCGTTYSYVNYGCLNYLQVLTMPFIAKLILLHNLNISRSQLCLNWSLVFCSFIISISYITVIINTSNPPITATGEKGQILSVKSWSHPPTVIPITIYKPCVTNKAKPCPFLVSITYSIDTKQKVWHMPVFMKVYKRWSRRQYLGQYSRLPLNCHPWKTGACFSTCLFIDLDQGAARWSQMPRLKSHVVVPMDLVTIGMMGKVCSFTVSDSIRSQRISKHLKLTAMTPLFIRKNPLYLYIFVTLMWSHEEFFFQYLSFSFSKSPEMSKGFVVCRSWSDSGSFFASYPTLYPGG